ncbi:MAG: hypothetical protein ABI591_13675 [Kofleriaceae bacterium]
MRLDVYYYGVKLAAVIAEDCGPCSQLVVSIYAVRNPDKLHHLS